MWLSKVLNSTMFSFKMHDFTRINILISKHIMDRSWMKTNTLSMVYEIWVVEFFEFAERKLHDNIEIIYCPCVMCENIIFFKKKVILSHLCCDKISQLCTVQMWHGEVDKNQITTSHRDEVDIDMDDWIEYMICDIGEDYCRKDHVYDTLCSDKDEPLYTGCTNFTQLSLVLRLFNVNAKIGLTYKSFT